LSVVKLDVEHINCKSFLYSPYY